MTNGMRRNSWHVALSAHNPEVATPPPPLPIGLSCTNGQVLASRHPPLNGIRETTSSVRVGTFWTYTTSARAADQAELPLVDAADAGQLSAFRVCNSRVMNRVRLS